MHFGRAQGLNNAFCCMGTAMSSAQHQVLLQDADFRPTSVDVKGTAQAVSLVLCNDKPTTFGAPDVLDFCADNLKLSFTLDQSFSDRPPNQVASLDVWHLQHLLLYLASD